MRKNKCKNKEQNVNQRYEKRHQSLITNRGNVTSLTEEPTTFNLCYISLPLTLRKYSGEIFIKK